MSDFILHILKELRTESAHQAAMSANVIIIRAATYQARGNENTRLDFERGRRDVLEQNFLRILRATHRVLLVICGTRSCLKKHKDNKIRQRKIA